jgi:hypothetical protein
MASEILFPEPTIGGAELTLLANDKSPNHSSSNDPDYDL